MEPIEVLFLDTFFDKSTTALIGRQEGRAFLKRLKDNGFDLGGENKVTIVVPDRIVTINNSFFQGLFGEIIENLGSAEDFLEKYEFQASEHIENKIERYACGYKE